MLRSIQLSVAALSDPASAELPPNRASKPNDRRIERSSIEMAQHAFHYATCSIMSPNRPCAKLVDLWRPTASEGAGNFVASMAKRQDTLRRLRKALPRDHDLMIER